MNYWDERRELKAVQTNTAGKSVFGEAEVIRLATAGAVKLCRFVLSCREKTNGAPSQWPGGERDWSYLERTCQIPQGRRWKTKILQSLTNSLSGRGEAIHK